MTLLNRSDEERPARAQRLERKVLQQLSRDHRKSTGIYFTPEPVARLTAQLALARLSDRRGLSVIDPAAGSGRLLCAFRQEVCDQPVRLHACEQEPKLIDVLQSLGGIATAGGDGLRLFDPEVRATALGQRTFDVVLGNPPYFGEKHHRAQFADFREAFPDLASQIGP
ncbi:MAG: N-6 DNA methylase, partial [Myxococcales bacterium]|nr:N-6 DNA methylase [Myxococcales bacterium]